MAFDSLSGREREILQNLIDHYIQTADPVGSRVIANRYNLGISPATIRNTMQDLEEMGLIKQPHTSAGRRPTDIGYRVFVDMLLKQKPLTISEKKKINSIKNAAAKGIDSVLTQTSKVLGEITNQLGMTIAPKFNKGILRRIDLIPVADGKLLLVFSVESGLARSILIEVESAIDSNEIILLETVLNERLSGLKLGHIRQTISERLADTNLSPKLLKLFIDPDDDIWSVDKESSIHIKGTDNLLSQPEFNDRSKLINIVKFLEEREGLIDLIENKSLGEGIIITIGSESNLERLHECSMVTSKYRAGKLSGTIGIIGPTRMPYSKILSIVQYTARSLTDALTEI